MGSVKSCVTILGLHTILLPSTCILLFAWLCWGNTWLCWCNRCSSFQKYQ